MMAAALLACVLAQAPDERAISGKVVDGAGRPVGGVVVVVTGANLIRVASGRGYAPPRVLTGADGRFVFRSLPDGSFDLTATKNGYAEGAYGRRRPSGSSKSVVLSAARPLEDISISIWKTGAISGTLTDEAGEPIVNARLRLCKATLVGGARRFASARQTAMTDDRGEYRFGNLVPGDYIVAVSAPRPSLTVSGLEMVGQRRQAPAAMMTALPGLPTAVTVLDAVYGVGPGAIVPPPLANGHLMVYPPTFYASTPSVTSATVIRLASGEDRSGIDIQLQPIASGRVAGVLIASDGPGAGALVRLESTALDGVQLGDAGGEDDLITLADSAGRFVFPAVPFGDYRLRAAGGPSNREWTNTPLSVAGDLDPIVVTMRPPIKIIGRYVYEGGLDAPESASGGTSQSSMRPAPFMLLPADGSALVLNGLSAFTSPQGFTMEGFTSGRYFGRVAESPRGWMFKSAVSRGVDISEIPIDLTDDITDLVITFTNQWSGIGGTVHDAGGAPDAAAAVLVFPANADAWRNYGPAPRRLKSGPTNARGEFGISSLPPGEYYAVAIPEDDSDNWRDPETLDALARVATTVTIGEGEHRTIELHTQRVPR